MEHDVHRGRVTKIGNSSAVIIPPEVRDRLRFLRGDLILMSVWGDLLIMRRATRKTILTVEQIPASVIPGEPIKEA